MVYVIQVLLTVCFYSKNKFEKLVHLVGFIIRIYHDARSPERQISSNTCDLICVLGLLTGVWRACWLCPADTEHVRARQNGQWADVMLSAVPSHAAHTQPVTPPLTFIVSCHVMSSPLVALLLETRLRITTSLLLPGVAAHSQPHLCGYLDLFLIVL